MENIRIREMQLTLRNEREMLADFLIQHKLHIDEDVECAFGVFQGEALCGCGCAAGSTLKCFAIDESLRGQNVLGMLISHLSAERFTTGYDDLFVFTRPHNRELFAGCGMYPLCETESVLLLENRRGGVERFARSVSAAPEGVRDIGAAVMNCNPLTNGHLSLIRYAAAHSEFLYVFVVEENRSAFPFADRIALVRKATKDMPNVCVQPSGKYMISGATFPTYFLKETESPSKIQSELDITLFAGQIAPALHIGKRFAGQEPFDAVTHEYNETMRRLLPQYGIEFCEIPRAALDGEVISAGRVRALLRERGMCSEIERMVPACTAEYLRDRESV